MKLALCTICLNEAEFLEANYRQHKDWPGLVAWYFIHGSCKQYADANPHMVSIDGLSVDDTAAVLRELSEADERIHWANVPGPVSHADPAMEKSVLRNAYLSLMCSDTAPPVDWFAIIDADEFYAHEHQRRLSELMAKAPPAFESIRTTYHDLWRPPSIAHLPRWVYEVSGGYWSVPHTKFFRWNPAIVHGDNHQIPSVSRFGNTQWGGEQTCCKLPYDDATRIHLGFARNAATREATNRFYVKRGEGPQDGRQWYVDCRSAWETWKPGDVLPHGAAVTAVADPLIVETVKQLKLLDPTDATDSPGC